MLLSYGWYGQSGFSVMKIDESLKQMKEVSKHPMNVNYFGEGITYFPKDGLIYELTWKDNQVLVYSNPFPSGSTLQPPQYLRSYALPAQIAEGWGLTHDDDYLYVSNGSTTIYLCVPNPTLTGLDVVKTITVDTQGRWPHFNELEMVDSKYIYANAFLTSDIYKFSKTDGKLISIWNMKDLMDKQTTYVNSIGGGVWYDWGNNVLNGIAYSQSRGTFLLTGKRWDFVFEVTLSDG
jgi:glutaminyl-peptide cyclotransferase